MAAAGIDSRSRSERAVRGPLGGFLSLNKPSGMTSRAAVDRVARVVRGVKVGHAGTLDPLASGVLVVGLGAATRLIEYVQRMPKTYRAVVRLGARSDTLDAEGRVVEVADPRVPGGAEIEAVLAGLVGTIEQKPPEFSAIRVAGRRAYDLARAGLAVDLAPRRITIDRITIVAYEWPRLELEIACGRGTYIRSLARDVGEAVGCGGLIAELVRTRVGPFAEVDALDPLGLTAEAVRDRLVPASAAVADLPGIHLTAEQVRMVAQGKALESERLTGSAPTGEVALIGPDGSLVAIAEGVPGLGRIVPRRVLVAS
jgi:tRNA pseudouridine55 synthase